MDSIVGCFLKTKGGKNGDDSTEEVTIYDYFGITRRVNLRYSSGLLGAKRPTYSPLEKWDCPIRDSGCALKWWEVRLRIRSVINALTLSLNSFPSKF